MGDLAAAAATWTKVVEAEPDQRAGLAGAGARLRGAAGLGRRRRGAPRRDLGPSAAPEGREEVLLRIGGDSRDAASPITRRRSRPIARWCRPTRSRRPAVAGLERLLAGDPQADRPRSRGSRCPTTSASATAAKLAGANEALLAVADTTGERVARLEKLRALYGGPLADPRSAYRAALALFEIDPTDVPNRDALLKFAEGAGTTGELVDKLRIVLGGRRSEPAARPPGDRRRARGAAPRARLRGGEGLRPDPAERAAPRRGVPRPVAPLSRQLSAGPSCGLCSTTRQHGVARRQGAARAARPDGGARRGVPRRPRSRARRLREDAGAGSERSARPPGPGSALHRARALAGSRDAARHAGRVRLGARDRRSGVPPGRAARDPARRRRRRRSTARDDRRRRPQPRGGAPAARAAAGGARAAAAGRADPRAGLRGERRLGAAGRQSTTCSARRSAAPRRRACWPGPRISRRPSCRRGRGARFLAAGAGGRSGPLGGAAADRAAVDDAGALRGAGGRLPGAGVQARRRATSAAAPICSRGRRSCSPAS